MDVISYTLSKKYTDDSLIGGGAVAGKPCKIKSITPITGGNRVTFEWTLDNGTTQTQTMDVKDGEQGEQGEDYVLTSADKNEIANIVIGELTEAETEAV